MTRYLIVNADDFGLCEEITNGILKSYKQGIVTSTSVAVNGDYFNKSINLLKDSGIDAGIHLTFVGGEKPVSGPIDGLIDNNGLFLKTYGEIIPRLITGRFDKKALKKELHAQVSILKDAGIGLSHIDSHQHLHLLPPLRTILIDIANQFKIKWIRVPQSNLVTIGSMGINILGFLLKKRLSAQQLCSTNNFMGFENRGRINEAVLLAKLQNLKQGITELMVHPGYDASKRYDWGYSWEEEINGLTSETVKELVKENGIVLTNFREIQLQ
ncbi:MAG: ChbG/HpnK family deacetylase [Deltaproteobacteria bacterium]|nr:ChbG/HpnK family deacetylase [Deltaproteobacteria bacterium]